MKILGLDISSVATGWAISEEEQILARGVVNPVNDLKENYGTKAKTKESLDEFDIIQHISGSVSKLIDEHGIEFLVVEDCFLGKNVRTLQVLARLSGAILGSWLARGNKRKPILISASRARAYLGCKGNAKKDQVKAFLKYKWGWEVQDDNEADAIVLAMCGFGKLRYVDKTGHNPENLDMGESKARKSRLTGRRVRCRGN